MTELSTIDSWKGSNLSIMGVHNLEIGFWQAFDTKTLTNQNLRSEPSSSTLYDPFSKKSL